MNSPLPTQPTGRHGPVSNAAWALALLCLVLAILDGIAGVFAGIGYRLDLWSYRDGIGALRYVFWLAAGTAVAALLALVLGIISRRRGAQVAGLVALLIAGTTAYIPWNLREAVRRVPPIHDISTDTVNPPQYFRVAELRKSTDHPVTYAGSEVATLQRKGYPDIEPVVLKAPADKVFGAAKNVLLGMGLTLLEADASKGHLEATDTSLLFGFEDDVVVRIMAGTDGATRVDIRSKSRVGSSDLGINAGRIRLFTATLRKKFNS